MSRRLALVPLALLLLARARPAAAALDADALAARTWCEVRSEHLRVLTDAPPGVATAVARRLEQLAAVLQAAHPGLRARPAQPVDVLVFHDEAEARPFTPAQVENASGFIAAAAGRNLLVTSADMGGNERAAAIGHTWSHLWLRANVANPPPWLDEGLAELHETFRPRGARAEYGHAQDALARWVRARPPADLGLLFALNAQSEAYRLENELRTATYAEGWALVHWLAADSARAAKLDSALVRMRAGETARAAFASQFPAATWPVLMQDVKRYASGGMFDAHVVALPPALLAPAATSRAVAPGEALMRLGEAMLARGDEGLADVAALEAAALARDSSLAEARAAAGWAADALGDSARAEASYARAANQAPDDARVALFAGLGTLARARRLAARPGERSPRVHELLAGARARLERCLRLADGDLEAIAGLGRVAAADGRVPDATLHALEHAAAELPERADVAQALATARTLHEHALAAARRWGVAGGADLAPTAPPHGRESVLAPELPAAPARPDPLTAQINAAMRARDYDTAARLLRRLRRQGTAAGAIAPDTARLLALCRMLQGLQHAYALADAGRIAAAEDTVAAVGPLAPDAPAREAVARASTSLAGRRLILSALALARGGDAAGARAELDRALALPLDDALRDYATSQRVRLSEAAPHR